MNVVTRNNSLKTLLVYYSFFHTCVRCCRGCLQRTRYEIGRRRTAHRWRRRRRCGEAARRENGRRNWSEKRTAAEVVGRRRGGRARYRLVMVSSVQDIILTHAQWLGPAQHHQQPSFTWWHSTVCPVTVCRVPVTVTETWN